MANYMDDPEYKELEVKKTGIEEGIKEQEESIATIQADLDNADEESKGDLEAELEEGKQLLEEAKTMLDDTVAEMKQLEEEYEEATTLSELVEEPTVEEDVEKDVEKDIEEDVEKDAEEDVETDEEDLEEPTEEELAMAEALMAETEAIADETDEVIAKVAEETPEA
ncbi:MAG: hypothetical protein AB8E82_04800 [Aureispira sp.]